MSTQLEADANLVGRGLKALAEMDQAGAAAHTEDTYTQRIPGKTLQDWRQTMHDLLFRVRSETDI